MCTYEPDNEICMPVSVLVNVAILAYKKDMEGNGKKDGYAKHLLPKSLQLSDKSRN